jgi:hypothetical protein
MDFLHAKITRGNVRYEAFFVDTNVITNEGANQL